VDDLALKTTETHCEYQQRQKLNSVEGQTNAVLAVFENNGFYSMLVEESSLFKFYEAATVACAAFRKNADRRIAFLLYLALAFSKQSHCFLSAFL
jgi:hypothetical protein